MATLESYRALRSHMIIASKLVGVEMWTAPGKVRPASCFIVFQILLYFVGSAYTIIKYRHDLFYVLKILMTVGTAAVLFVKFAVSLFGGEEFDQYGKDIERDLLKPYQAGTPEEVAVLARTGRFLWLLSKVWLVAISSTGVGFLLYPLLVYFVEGKLVPLFLYELPFLDWHYVELYFVNLVFQIQLYVFGAIGAVLSDFVIVMYSFYALAKADICIVHLHELRTMLNDGSKMADASDIAALKKKWQQCISDHRSSTRFLNNLEHLFGLTCLAQVVTGVFTVCISMLLVLLTDWYPVYLFLAATFIELSAFFVIGNLVEKKVDELYDAITSLSWYRLSLQQQKEYGFIVFRQQRPIGLTAFGFMPLNFESYMNVLKGLYQFFVLMLKSIQ
ncbi:odorant receptor 30a-like [Anopheles aquasalis]|uniref:odorant receptor 30a-like n=1 Tax=Anopheles aquasalis TaxID=42839 RepID=UPI00215B1B00|nr:odorant receptor 30a-like [Anopheles aquasalis]